MNHILAVIFDLDGVIVHTDRFHFKAWKQVADEIGVAFTEETNNRLRGVSRMESLDIILEQYDKVMTCAEKILWAEKKNEIYKELLQAMSKDDVTTEVRETLSTLKNNGYKIAIGSSSKNALFILKKVQLSSFFDAISDGNNIVNSKPDPEVFLKAAKFLCVDPKRCVIVEDAIAGIQAAKAACMISIAIGDAADKEAGDYNITHFSELIVTIGENQ